MSTYNAIKYDFTPPAGTFGAMTLISEQTASASASISFTSGIDSTYRTYYFKFINIHPASSGVFHFQTSTNGGSSYGVTATTTGFQAYHGEADTGDGLVYGGGDLAQGTGYSTLNNDIGTGNDQNLSGELWLFNPSSTTYVKHYTSRTNSLHSSDFSVDMYSAGYFNTTSAVNAINFKMASGNIDAGTIQMYGIA